MSPADAAFAGEAYAGTSAVLAGLSGLPAGSTTPCDVFAGGRKMRVNVSPNVEPSELSELRLGQEVVLNEALNVVIAQSYKTVGEVVMLKEVLADAKRALVISQADDERVIRLAEPLHQRFRRARADGRVLLQAVVSPDELRP